MKVGFAQNTLSNDVASLVVKILSGLTLEELRDRAETVGLELNGTEDKEDLILSIARAIIQGV